MKCHGKWWFPQYQNNEFTGILSFTQRNGGKLEVKGIVSTNIYADKGLHSTDDKIILGKTNKGKNITVHVSLLNWNVNPLSDSITLKFIVKSVFIGIHFEKFEDIKFDSILIQYQNCDKWFTKPTLYQARIVDKKGKKYCYNDPIVIENENGHGFKIQIFAISKINYNNHKPIQNKKIYANIITFDNKRPFKEYQNIYENINDFFNFFSHEEIDISIIEGNCILDNGNCINHIKIIYQQLDEKMNKIKTMIPYNIRYENISDNFSNILFKWFKVKDEIRVIYDRFFGVMYNPHLYRSNMLQMFTECIEYYHREFMEKKSMAKADKTLRSNRVMNDIKTLIKLGKEAKLSVFTEKSDLSWLKERVNHKSPTLIERINETYQEYKNIIEVLARIEEKEEFSKKIKYYRDDFSHAKSKYETIDNLDLFWKVEKLHLFVKLIFLTRLGFTNENIKRLFVPDNY